MCDSDHKVMVNERIYRFNESVERVELMLNLFNERYKRREANGFLRCIFSVRLFPASLDLSSFLRSSFFDFFAFLKTIANLEKALFEQDRFRWRMG